MLQRLSAGVLAAMCLGGLGRVVFVMHDGGPAARPGAPPASSAAAAPAEGSQDVMARNLLRSTPVSFERNTGQHPAAGEFVARGPGYLLSLQPNEARVALRSATGAAPTPQDVTRPQGIPPRPDLQWTEVRMTLVGGNPGAPGRLEGRREARANYFLGSDAARWRTGVEQFDGVRFSAVYPGIDLVYYSREATLEYDLVVQPGASPETIELAFSGARDVSLSNDGALVLTTAIGELRQPAPVIYQERAGRREPVTGRFVLRDDDRVGFEVGAYDASAPLVIDPVLQYSTYFGGSEYDIAYELEVDSAGAMYIAGETAGTLPVSGYDTTQNGSWDAFIAKFNSAGALVFSTYYGSVENDAITGLSIDALGNVYVSGYPGADVPTTAGAYQTTRNGADIFIVKLASSGFALSYATYLGSGPNFDGSSHIEVDAAGAAYVVGNAGSSDFPTTVGAWDRTFSGPNEAFVTKLNPAGSQLVFSTFLGGSDVDWGQSIAVHANGTIYVTGYTSSCDFPTTVGAFDRSCNGVSDAFVTALQPSGAGLVWSTYFGGSASDYANRIAVDPAGEVVIAGGTSSENLPEPRNFLLCCDNDGFVARIASGGGSVLHTWYIGGYGSDNVLGLALDSAGAAFITGWTTDNDEGFPITPGAFKSRKPSEDLADGFIVKVSPDGWLDYATYVGATESDGGTDIDVGRDGAVYLTGWTDTGTSRTAFPVTLDGLVTIGQGNFDAFLMRFDAPMDRSLQVGVWNEFPLDIPAGGSVDSWDYLGGRGYYGIIEEVRVSVYVTHTWDSDLSLTLISPDGTSVLLTQGLGGSGDNYGSGCGQEWQRTTFSDAATLPIGSGNAPFVGSFRPLQPLSAFNGEEAGGTWTLRATDIVTQDTGAIQCWTVHIRFRSPTVTSISPANGTVNGGTTVTITGTNFMGNGDIQPTVRIGGVPVTRTSHSATTFTGVTTARYAGLSDVAVTDALGRTGVLRDAFTYQGVQTLTVNGAGLGNGTVTTPAGFAPAINCTITAGVTSGTCTQNYAYGVVVSLNATAAPTHTFNGWSGACTSTPCSVTMTAPRTATATFTPPGQQLTVTGAGSGNGTVTSQAGLSPAINCTITGGVASGTCAASYPFNTSVTLTASATGGGSFTGWGGGCAGSGGCTVVMSQARSVTATFSAAPQTLTVSGSGAGSGVVTSQAGLSPAINCTITAGVTSGTCSAVYPLNTSVTLTATASGGGSFNGWSGACSGASCTVVMSQPRGVVATFTPPAQLLTVSGSGTGNGVVTSQAGLSPAINCTITAGVGSGTCSASYPYNTSVTLTATATGAGSFTGWGGACGGATCSVVMTQARSVTAIFANAPMTIETMTPASGSTAGGTLVTVRGSRLSGSAVTVGGQPARSVRQIDAQTMTFLTPAGNAGAANMTMVGPSGLVERMFTYQVPEDGSIPGARNAQFDYDGRYLVFESDVALVADDTNGVADIYVIDRQTPGAAPVRVSVTSQQLQAIGGESVTPAISSTGRVVAFASRATNLVPGDGNGVMDVFVHDRDTDGDGIYDEAGAVATSRVSVGPGGVESDGPSTAPTISGTGRWVAFVSTARTLRPGATDNEPDVFVRDRTLGTTVAVTFGSGGASGAPVISLDGRFVAFESQSAALVANDTNGVTDVFLHDRDVDEDGVFDETGASGVTRISVASGGGQGVGGPSTEPSITQEGRWTVFASVKTNLVAGDTNGVSDVFIHDRVLHTTTRLSRTPEGAEDTASAVSPTISANGAVVHYVREAGAAGASVARAGVVAAAAGSVFGIDIEVPDPTNPNPPPPPPPDPDAEPTSQPCVSGNGQATCGEGEPSQPGAEPDTDFEGQPPPPTGGAVVPVIFDWSSRRGYWNEAATVDIEGQGFGPTSTVFVEGQAVATELRGQSLRIQVAALPPPALTQPVNRRFEVRNGSLASNTALFWYDPLPGAGGPPTRSNPVVNTLTVTRGPTAGNTEVAVEGSGFSAATVLVDGVGVTPTSQLPTRLVFRTPPHAAGIVAVAVRNGDGVTAANTPAYTYELAAMTQAPVITGVNPNPALAGGNTPLTISGQHFAPGATVLVAGVAATQVVVVSDTQIQALAPARPANVAVGAGVALSVTINGQTGQLPAALSFIEFDPFVVSPIDADGDGLHRNWEGAYGLNDGNAADAAADPDGDGRTNAQEFADGTHPLSFYSRYFAEGASGSYFSTRLSIANPNDAPATVLLRVLTDSGQTLPKYVVIPALSKRTILVDDEVPGAAFGSFASVIESDVEVIADRSMFWNQDSGSTAETSVPAPALQWHLAEGATSFNTEIDFYLFYLLQNPSLTTAAQVRIRYLKPDGIPIERFYTVAPRSRLTIEVDKVPGLEQVDVSGAIESLNNVPVIAERAMYVFDVRNPGRGWIAGHASTGVTAPATNWFLAEGATGAFFDLWVLIANPNPQPAEMRLTYMLESGVNIVKLHTVPGNSRQTVYVRMEDPLLANASVATRVESTNGVPVVVERAMWWPAGRLWQEGHNSAGSTSTGVKWGLAEGQSGGTPANSRTYILIANTAAATATVRVTLLFEGQQTPIAKDFTVLPNSRKTIDVLTEFPATAGLQFGAVIESLTGEPIVVERAMYSDAFGVTFAAGTNALGTRLR